MSLCCVTVLWPVCHCVISMCYGQLVTVSCHYGQRVTVSCHYGQRVTVLWSACHCFLFSLSLCHVTVLRPAGHCVMSLCYGQLVTVSCYCAMVSMSLCHVTVSWPACRLSHVTVLWSDCGCVMSLCYGQLVTVSSHCVIANLSLVMSLCHMNGLSFTATTTPTHVNTVIVFGTDTVVYLYIYLIVPKRFPPWEIQAEFPRQVSRDRVLLLLQRSVWLAVLPCSVRMRS